MTPARAAIPAFAPACVRAAGGLALCEAQCLRE